ncbi:MAG: N-acetylmuramoyl-L-alanine amidase [Candidatus Margulisbacteria bacterium]|nr:N-acetylmuramoyl-L-alanine amidase [Candidatus Margulisiibacteriota bacterium]
MLRKLLSLIIFIIICSPAITAEKILIKRIEVHHDRGLEYLDIYTDGYVEGEGLLLENKLVLEFPKATVSPKVKIKLPKKKLRLIKKVRPKPKTDQIVLDLNKEIDYEIVNVFGRNKSVVEIRDRVDHTEEMMAAWEKKTLKLKAPKLEPKKYIEVKKTKKVLPLRGRIIVIDPGHGGLDPGAVAANGIAEKHLTLKVAKKIAYLLNEAGATVYLTRHKDRTVSIRELASFANRVKADIFVSIHYNYSYIKKVAGTETYYWNRQSRNLALTLHRSLVRGLKRRDRGLRRAKFYTINHTSMPAVILEPVFISNAEESKLASSAAYQAKLAQIIANGVKQYFRSKAR